jgi:hypothetical protein
MKTVVGATWIALLALVPVACVQSAIAQEIASGGGASTEEVIAKMLSVLLTSAGAPAAVITGVAAVMAFGARYARRGWAALSAAEPLDMRVRFGSRTYHFAIEVDSARMQPALHPVVDATDTPHAAG